MLDAAELIFLVIVLYVAEIPPGKPDLRLAAIFPLSA